MAHIDKKEKPQLNQRQWKELADRHVDDICLRGYGSVLIVIQEHKIVGVDATNKRR